jgi:diacylglycerol O-acyltransferase / wax synthase
MMRAAPEILQTAKDRIPAQSEVSPADLAKKIAAAPRMAFNVLLEPERKLGTVTLSVSGFKVLSKANDATINDLVLVVCGGAIRRYLAKRGQLPEKPLIAALPVSLRDQGDTTVSNQVTMMMTSLATDIEDPIKRLKAVQESVTVAKHIMSNTRAIARLRVSMPAMRLPLFNNLSEFLERMRAVEVAPPYANLFISNVPGPRNAMFCAGVPATHNYPVSLLMNGVGVNVTLTSYLDNMEFGVLTSPNAADDAQEMADLIGDEFEQLKRALSARKGK